MFLKIWFFLQSTLEQSSLTTFLCLSLDCRVHLGIQWHAWMHLTCLWSEIYRFFPNSEPISTGSTPLTFHHCRLMKHIFQMLQLGQGRTCWNISVLKLGKMNYKGNTDNTWDWEEDEDNLQNKENPGLQCNIRIFIKTITYIYLGLFIPVVWNVSCTGVQVCLNYDKWVR